MMNKMTEDDKQVAPEKSDSEFDERLRMINETEQSLKDELHSGNIFIKANEKSISLCINVIMISTIIFMFVLTAMLYTADCIMLTLETIILLAIIGLITFTIRKLLEIYSEDHKRQEQRFNTIYKCIDKLQELKVLYLEKELNKKFK